MKNKIIKILKYIGIYLILLIIVSQSTALYIGLTNPLSGNNEAAEIFEISKKSGELTTKVIFFLIAVHLLYLLFKNSKKESNN